MVSGWRQLSPALSYSEPITHSHEACRISISFLACIGMGQPVIVADDQRWPLTASGKRRPSPVPYMQLCLYLLSCCLEVFSGTPWPHFAVEGLVELEKATDDQTQPLTESARDGH